MNACAISVYVAARNPIEYVRHASTAVPSCAMRGGRYSISPAASTASCRGENWRKILTSMSGTSVKSFCLP